jgi:hypothetical protein
MSALRLKALAHDEHMKSLVLDFTSLMSSNTWQARSDECLKGIFLLRGMIYFKES